jgi:hypothetical protein
LPPEIYTATQHDADAAKEKNQPPAKLLHAPPKTPQKIALKTTLPPPSIILTVSCLASRSSLPQNHKLVALIMSVFPAGFNFLNSEPKRSDFWPPHNRSQALFIFYFFC